ncbi:hypothetical protein MGYG_02379 [Nannizzia gypsea CBS 118893]|uniref:Uncharacterized protein n=1 Tax=Arthroderma gypseum (strain ATCC MYA-4604 / CBS 118893) TaxID=535722 RepID=E4UR93_ARTGP|nr:hypothetical protein MGYG_02379 [Nannizzia gypsea CBS 118893]EFQ99368.1 hypothetical protein MGYG_02379 [Nannizzia gypsea CBS 118893]
MRKVSLPDRPVVVPEGSYMKVHLARKLEAGTKLVWHGYGDRFELGSLGTLQTTSGICLGYLDGEVIIQPTCSTPGLHGHFQIAALNFGIDGPIAQIRFNAKIMDDYYPIIVKDDLLVLGEKGAEGTQFEIISS